MEGDNSHVGGCDSFTPMSSPVEYPNSSPVDSPSATNEAETQGTSQTVEGEREPLVGEKRLRSTVWEHFTKIKVNGINKAESGYGLVKGNAGKVDVGNNGEEVEDDDVEIKLGGVEGVVELAAEVVVTGAGVRLAEAERIDGLVTSVIPLRSADDRDLPFLASSPLASLYRSTPLRSSSHATWNGG
nr:zinc finger BED domain-containing protein RICESLEEPER 3-like [Ipomoea batatas]